MSVVLDTYARAPLRFVRGEGPYLFTETGERYLDFAAGIAVNALGHAEPRLIEALTDQARRLWHTSNKYIIPAQEALAAELVHATFADLAFFCNSGAEAVEGGLKIMRRHQYGRGEPQRTRVIVFDGAFHGRTMATLSAGAQSAYLEGFGPALEGFDRARFDDLASVEALIGPETAGVLLEPVQGDGGLRTASRGFVEGLRELTRQRGLVLMFDEVQTGVGRTGRFLAHEHFSVEPDIVSVAKGLGGGFPIGAVLVTKAAAEGMTRGSHASTFGGNPLACAVAKVVVEEVSRPDFLAAVRETGATLAQALDGLVERHPAVFDARRGLGLMAGLKCRVPNGEVEAGFRDQGLLCVAAGDNVIRLLPPLNITAQHVAEAAARMDAAAAELLSTATA